MSTIQQETSHPWRPSMVFRAQRRVEDPVGLLENFIETGATTFYRKYFPATPNANFGTMMTKATHFVIAIVSIFFCCMVSL